jgi:hypothetical protein
VGQKTRVLNKSGSARPILPPARVGMHRMLDLDLVQPISCCISNCLHDRGALLPMSDGVSHEGTLASVRQSLLSIFRPLIHTTLVAALSVA